MSDIELQIGGRAFKVACAPGEEEHVAGLGRMIDGKIANLNMAGQGEGRMLLFASLLLADELHEARQRSGTGTAPASVAQADPAMAERLEAIAAALEKCALALES